MAYPTIAEFDRNYINRTLRNLEGNHQYEFTNLLNSMIGLIVLPRQMMRQGRRNIAIFNQTLDNFAFLANLQNQTTVIDDHGVEMPVEKFYNARGTFNEMTLGQFITNLRNSIAHQSLRPTRDGDIWKGVFFRCYQINQEEQAGEWANIHHFQIYLDKDEISAISIAIARLYLENLY